MPYVVYSIDTGAIKYLLHASESDLVANVPEGCSALPYEGTLDDTLFVVDMTPTAHAITAKVTIPYALSATTIQADGLDVATISGLPAGCTATIDKTPYQVDGTFIEFSADFPGRYDILLQRSGFLDTSVLVVAE